MKRGVLLAGALLVGIMGSLLMMAIDSVDEEAGPVLSEEGSFLEDASPFRSSSGAQPDLAGPAWFSTTGSGKDSQ
jgi:hypothetical protein